MSVYSSRGTVRVTAKFGGDSLVPNGSIQFIPDPDHLVKHKGKCYAAFVSESSGSIDDGSIDEHLLLLKDDGYGSHSISLECSTGTGEALDVAVAVGAATSQTKVEVEIEIKKLGASLYDCKVIAITIPAK